MKEIFLLKRSQAVLARAKEKGGRGAKCFVKAPKQEIVEMLKNKGSISSVARKI